MEVQMYRDAMEACLRRVMAFAEPVMRHGGGGAVVRGVAGRENEDVEIELDRDTEQIYRQVFLDERELSVRIIGEHYDYGAPDAECVMFVDPFDGSGPWTSMQYKASVYYSVASVFDADGVPFLGGCLDIIERKLYLAGDAGVEVISLDDETRETGESAKPTALSEATVATYSMRSKYARLTFQRARGIFEGDVYPGYFHPTGGSFMPAVLAVGKERVAAYFLAEEMYPEVIPGAAFIRAAGLHTAVLASDTDSPRTWKRSVIPFEFDPDAHREDGDTYREADRLHLFVMATTQELLAQLVAAALTSVSDD